MNDRITPITPIEHRDDSFEGSENNQRNIEQQLEELMSVQNPSSSSNQNRASSK